MCSTIGHTHERFVSIKQCLKHHQQLVQTTTILDLSVVFGILEYKSTKSSLYQLTHAITTTVILISTQTAPSVEEIDVYHSFLTQSLPRKS